MSQFDILQSITSRLKELGGQLSSSKLPQEELEEFETLSRKLYEITVILNYKAKEEIYRKSSIKKTESVESKKEPVRESRKEDIENEGPLTKKSDEAPAARPHGLVEFDFSGEPRSSKDTSSEAKDLKTNDDQVAPKEEEQKYEAQDIPSQKQSEMNSEQETNIPQDEITSFYQHFSVTYKEALKDKLSNSKIDSIKNAIGLNEKLQFIGELFSGSSELFNQTVEELDQLEGYEVALKKLSEIATQKRWDKEAELVDQFANIVNRRYVE